MDQTNTSVQKKSELTDNISRVHSHKAQDACTDTNPSCQCVTWTEKLCTRALARVREKSAQEDQTGPAAGRREASVDLSPMPTFMAAIGCGPAAGLHLIGRGFRAGM